MDELKLCINCRWYMSPTQDIPAMCNSPKNSLLMGINLVDGWVTYDATGEIYCRNHRMMGGSETHCNASGDWFQPREATDESEGVGADSPTTLGDLGSGLPVDSDLPELK